MSDLSKMTVPDMNEWCDDIDRSESYMEVASRRERCMAELARRLAEVTAERDRLARQWFDGEQWIELEPDEVRRRREEAGRTLAKWHTADGVFYPDMPGFAWWADHAGVYEVSDFTVSELGVRGMVHDYPVDGGFTLTKPLRLCYSTREAAEAAQRGGEVGNG